MPRTGTTLRFLDVLSYQVLATRNYLRHFLKGVRHEFLPEELQVQIDWKLNAFSLTFLLRPACEYMDARRSVNDSELRSQIALQDGHLQVVQKYLVDAYQTYVRFADSSPEKSRFEFAKPWLIAGVEHAVFACDEWLKRVFFERSGRVSSGIDRISGLSLDGAALDEWRDVVAHDLPLPLTDLRQNIADLDQIAEAVRCLQGDRSSLRSRILSENPLLQLCMASRRLLITAFFLLLTNRPAVGMNDVEEASRAIRRALDAVESEGALGAPEFTGLAAEGIRLLKERFAILELLCDSVDRSDDNPAAELVLAETRVHCPRNNSDRLLMGLEVSTSA